MGDSINEGRTRIKVVIERGEDAYVAYPLGMKGVVVGQGETYDEALADVTSAIQAHIKQFGSDVIVGEDPALEAFIAEAEVAI
jgi:predicted RNase H-like HicB family nuclease